MNPKNSISSANNAQSSLRKKRVGKACDSCRLKKTKCSGKQPCEKCIADNKICIYTQRKKSHDKTYSYEYVEMMEKRLCIVKKSLLRLCDLVRLSDEDAKAGRKNLEAASSNSDDATHDLEQFKQRMTYDRDAENGPFSINQIVSLLISSEELKHDLNDEDKFFKRIGAAEELFQKLKKEKNGSKHGRKVKSKTGNLQTRKKRQRKSARALVNDPESVSNPTSISAATSETSRSSNSLKQLKASNAPQDLSIPRPRASSVQEHDPRPRGIAGTRARSMDKTQVPCLMSSSAPTNTSANFSLAFSGSNGSSSNSLSDSVSSPSPDSLFSETAFPYQAGVQTYAQPLHRIREEAGTASMDAMIDLDSFALPGFNSGAQFATAAMNGYFNGGGSSSRSSNSSGVSENTTGPSSATSIASSSFTLNELGGVTSASSFDNFKIPSKLNRARQRSSGHSLTELPSPGSNSSSKLADSLFGAPAGVAGGESSANFFDSLVSPDVSPNMLRKPADLSLNTVQQPEYLVPANRNEDILRMQDRPRSMGSELDVL